MRQSKDPFEAGLEKQEESPPDFPIDPDELESQAQSAPAGLENEFETASTPMSVAGGSNVIVRVTKNKEDEEEEEEHVDVELAKFPSSADPSEMAKMQAILSQFTEEQMNRY